MKHWLLLLAVLLGAVLPRPLRQSPLHQGRHLWRQARPARRVDYLVPEDFSAPLELPQPHFGLVDDYGIKPKQLHFRTWATRAQPAGLRSAGKSKRDELDMSEYYYDDHL